jgi:hypothetical protein
MLVTHKNGFLFTQLAISTGDKIWNLSLALTAMKSTLSDTINIPGS